MRMRMRTMRAKAGVTVVCDGTRITIAVCDTVSNDVRIEIEDHGPVYVSCDVARILAQALIYVAAKAENEDV